MFLTTTAPLWLHSDPALQGTDPNQPPFIPTATDTPGPVYSIMLAEQSLCQALPCVSDQRPPQGNPDFSFTLGSQVLSLCLNAWFASHNYIPMCAWQVITASIPFGSSDPDFPEARQPVAQGMKQGGAPCAWLLAPRVAL